MPLLHIQLKLEKIQVTINKKDKGTVVYSFNALLA